MNKAAEAGWAFLKRYMVDRSTSHVPDDWSVADGFYITYNGRPVHGCTNIYLATENEWGESQYLDMNVLDWSKIEVYERISTGTLLANKSA